MKVVVAHPTGNRNVRAILEAFDNNDALLKFVTTVSIKPSAAWLHLIPEGLRDELLRRTYPIASSKIKSYPSAELVRLLVTKLAAKNLIKAKNGIGSVTNIYKEIDAKTSKIVERINRTGNIDAVYAYEDGALRTFSKAKQLGLKCFYDLPIAYWETGRRLMQEEAERLPYWAKTMLGGITDPLEKLEAKTKELELADAVIVPGEFVKNSLPGWAKDKKVIVSPFGSPVIAHRTEPFLNLSKAKRPLRVLFVGSMGQRKGLGDIFKAIKLLNSSSIELVVMGSLLAPIDFYRKELPNFTHEPGRSNEQVLKLMRSCDVFCLPSIVEGRALVMQEAMSQGLPLIITPNTGGSDLIKEGETGFLVPIRSPEKIAEKLNWFLENAEKLPFMGSMSQQHAATYTWKNYGEKIVGLLSSFF